MARDRKLIFFALFSLLLHGGLCLILIQWPKGLSRSFEKLPVQVVYEAKPLQKKQRRGGYLAPDLQAAKNKEVAPPTEPALFLSDKTQRVHSQTQARLKGLTQNRDSRRPLGEALKPSLDFSRPLALYPRGDTAVVEKPKGEDFHPAAGGGLSSLSYPLSNKIKLGSLTALNSDRFLYYSFFSRLEQRLTPRWDAHTRAVLEQARLQNRYRIPSSGKWVTVVEVLLSPDGRYERGIVLQPSGWVALDNAVLAAFSEASPIPRPPAEMVKEDHYVHIQFAGTVEIVLTTAF